MPGHTTNTEEDAYSPDDEEEGEVAHPELRWEKGVEFALARELQTWHIIDRAAHYGANLDLDNKKSFANALLRHVEQRCREARYLPLDGNPEKTLGDALAGMAPDKLLLIECKEKIDKVAWKREALGEWQGTNKKGDPCICNKGGKDRLKTLNRIIAEEVRGIGASVKVEVLGKQCHFLIANGKLAGSPANDSLVFTSYWDFVFHPNEGDGIENIKPDPIAKMREFGLPREKFCHYIYALLQDDWKTSSGDASWIGRELIVLAHVSNQSNGESWIGGRILASELLHRLDLDHKFQQLIKVVQDREKLLDEERKLQAQAQLPEEQSASVSKAGAKTVKPGTKKT